MAMLNKYLFTKRDEKLSQRNQATWVTVKQTMSLITANQSIIQIRIWDVCVSVVLSDQCHMGTK